jgi:hypothetical protein
VSDKPPIERGRLFANILTGIRMCWAAAPLSFAAILAMVAVDAAIPAVVLLLSKQLVNRVVAGTGLTTALLAVIVGLGLASGLERAMSAVRRHWQDIFSQRVEQTAMVRFLSQAGTIDLGHLDQPEFQDHLEWTFALPQGCARCGSISLEMAALIESEFKATMGTPMTLVGPDGDFRPIPLGAYVSSVPDLDLQGYDFSTRTVERVYREPSGRFVHVLLAATVPNVFLVIVVDEPAQSVHGHHLLDLRREYGLY